MTETAFGLPKLSLVVDVATSAMHPGYPRGIPEAMSCSNLGGTKSFSPCLSGGWRGSEYKLECLKVACGGMQRG